MVENFTTALSERTGEEAIKEVSLKIKSVFPKSIKHIFTFFTPHYHPLSILKTIQFTLKPESITGAQSPLLIFEDRIIKKGIIVLCINKEETELKGMIIKDDDPQKIESCLRISFRELMETRYSFLSFIPPQINFTNYMRGVELALGKTHGSLGAGYINKYAAKHYHIINDTIEEGILNIACKNLDISPIKLSGFLPVGKPFTITKVISERGVILEINDEPAINIYKNYLEEKFDIFRKNRLFHLYPLGIIKSRGEYKLINILDCLEDGSLTCIGEVKNNVSAHIMLLHYPSLFETIKNKLKPIQKMEEGIVLMVNSLVRKKISGENAEEEIRLIKQHLGDKFKVIGIYSDYFISTDEAMKKNEVEAGNLLIAFLK